MSARAAARLRPPSRRGHGAHARAAWPQDHRRADRRAAARAGAAVPGSGRRRRCARPGARPQARAADRCAGRIRRRARASAGGAGDASRSGRPGARTADPRARAAACRNGISARGGCRCTASGSTAASRVASVATTIPSRDPKHLQRLLADKAAALDPEFGFDAFALTADWTEESARCAGEPGRGAVAASASWRGWSTG